LDFSNQVTGVLMIQHRNAGLAMIDVLVALLLLALTLAGACALLVNTMRSTRSALLTTRAVDLAADLAEDLLAEGAATPSAGQLASWRAQVAAVLPVGGLAEESFAQLAAVEQPAPTAGAPRLWQLTLRWNAGGGLRELSLPLSLPAPDAPR
jgi:Tfp pilus assembly protein PilV